MSDVPPPRPEWLGDPSKPLPRSSGLTSDSTTPVAGRSLPTLVLLVLLPILVIGFFLSVLAHVIVLAGIFALLAIVSVVRLALTSGGRV